MTTQTPDAVREAVPVIQADRDAAFSYWLYRGSLKPDDYRAVKWRRELNQGDYDGKEIVQAFARHRLAALDSRAGDDVRPDSWAATPEDIRECAQLLADVELHLKSSRVFITTRERMHPYGVELHDELLGRVTAAIDSIGKAKGHD